MHHIIQLYIFQLLHIFLIGNHVVPALNIIIDCATGQVNFTENMKSGIEGDKVSVHF